MTRNADYWTTKDGRCIKIQDMEDSHLLNVINYLKKKDKPIPKSIKAEVKKRGLTIGSTRLNGMEKLLKRIDALEKKVQELEMEIKL